MKYSKWNTDDGQKQSKATVKQKEIGTKMNEKWNVSSGETQKMERLKMWAWKEFINYRPHQEVK